MVGVAPGASIVSLKVFDSTGRGCSANIIDLSKVVINLSLGDDFNAALPDGHALGSNQDRHHLGMRQVAW